MGFEESMIEDGFHDEEEYLEHLMDKADKIFERQSKEQKFWDEHPNISSYEYYYDDKDDYPDEEYYREDWERYSDWAKNNHLQWGLFMLWFNTYENRYGDRWYSAAVVEAFLDWERGEKLLGIDMLKDYWNDGWYDVIYSILEWEEKNPIERILAGLELTSLHTETDTRYDQILFYKIEVRESWLEKKKEFESWLSGLNESEKNVFFSEFNAKEFNNDTSVASIIDCIKKSELDGFDKNCLIELFAKDPENSKAKYYYVKSVQYYDWRLL